MTPKVLFVIGLFIFTYMLNLPFGMLRSRARRFSLKWFLYIHIPIPFVFLARVLSQVELIYIPLFVLAALIGQIHGGKLEF